MDKWMDGWIAMSRSGWFLPELCFFKTSFYSDISNSWHQMNGRYRNHNTFQGTGLGLFLLPWQLFWFLLFICWFFITVFLQLVDGPLLNLLVVPLLLLSSFSSSARKELDLDLLPQSRTLSELFFYLGSNSQLLAIWLILSGTVPGSRALVWTHQAQPQTSWLPVGLAWSVWSYRWHLAFSHRHPWKEHLHDT